MLGFRVLVNLGVGFRKRFGDAGGGVVTRRDRSLGGREVVVGTTTTTRKSDVSVSRGLRNPLSTEIGEFGGAFRSMKKDWGLKREKKLPEWWPESKALPVEVFNKDEYQKQANRLIRGLFFKYKFFSFVDVSFVDLHIFVNDDMR